MVNVRPVRRTKQAWQQKYCQAVPQTKPIPQVKLVENANRGFKTNWGEE